MASLRKNRVSSTGENRPITRNEQKGRSGRERSARPVTPGGDDAVQPFRTIPGIIDVTRLERWTGASAGRCHVCDGDAIA